MNVLVKEDGTISPKQKEILQLQSKFYENPYQAEVNIEFKFKYHNDLKLSDIEKEQTNAKPSFQEITHALNNWN